MTESAPSPMQGVVSAHPRGFGFVVQDNGDEYFVSPPQMRSLLSGDRVCFSLAASPRREQLSAVVHEVLQRPESHWLGQLEPAADGTRRLRPDEPCQVPLRVDEARAQSVGAADVVQLRIAPNQGLGRPALDATLVANLGPRNDRDFDVRYAIAKWRLPVEFGEAALAQAHSCAEPSLERAQALGFADLSHLPFVTIDNETTRDFDDALCLVDEGALWTLHVAIAHVSHYVEPGSPLDQEARERATSVYLPGRSIPMLPPELSNGLCSLNPGALRYALVCSLSYTRQGALSGYSFRQAVLRSAARLSYAQVAANELPAEVEPMLRGLWQWFDTQQPARQRRGLFEYRDAEPRLVVPPDGDYAIEWVPLERSNELVEEAMLAANRAAAAHLTLLGAGLLFRHQQGLDPQRWQDTRLWLAARGVEAPPLPTLPDLRALLAGLEGRELRPQLEFRLRRAMTPAVYDERQSSHFSLGFHAYTHFTSPIRRYADLLVHRMLLGRPAGRGGRGAVRAPVDPRPRGTPGEPLPLGAAQAPPRLAQRRARARRAAELRQRARAARGARPLGGAGLGGGGQARVARLGLGQRPRAVVPPGGGDRRRQPGAAAPAGARGRGPGVRAPRPTAPLNFFNPPFISRGDPMYFSEPLTDLRTQLFTDNGEGIDVDFNVNLSVWRLTVDKGFSRETLRDMVRYLHGLFYLGEERYLADWLKVVDDADLTKRNTLTLKTVDRIGR